MINRATIIGRITKELELRYSPAGKAVLNFTVACNRPFKNANGEQEADFINVVAFGKQAENTANFQKKGSLIGIDGRIQTRTYEGQNGRVYVTEIVADSVAFLEKVTRPSSEQENGSRSQNERSQEQTRMSDDPFANSGQQIDISDDDLPF